MRRRRHHVVDVQIDYHGRFTVTIEKEAVRSSTIVSFITLAASGPTETEASLIGSISPNRRGCRCGRYKGRRRQSAQSRDRLQHADALAPKVTDRRLTGTCGPQRRPRHVCGDFADHSSRAQELADHPGVELAIRFPLEQFSQDLRLIRPHGSGQRRDPAANAP